MANQCSPTGSGFGGGGFPGGINPSDVQGIQGVQGLPGPQGIPGPPGPSPGTTPLDPNCTPIGAAPTRTANGNVSFDPYNGGYYSWADIEIDYSAHIDKLICEFHQHNVTHIAILNELRRLANNSDIIKVHQGTIAAMTTKIAGHQESIAMDTVRIRTVQEHMRTLADTTGITTRSPYEYLYTYSSLRSLDLDNISVSEAINGFNSLPSQTLASPGPGQTPQPSSPLRWEGPWDEKKQYKVDDLVYYADKAWIAQRPNIGAPPAENKIWKELTPELLVAAEEPKEVWKGTWNKNKNYPAGSIVMYKPGLEKESVDTLADIAYSSISGKLYRAVENIGTYIQTQVLPSDPAQSDGHTCWVEIDYCVEPDVCENILLQNVRFLSVVGDVSCNENKLARLELSAPIIVEQKNKNFDMPDFVDTFKGAYTASKYKDRAEIIREYYISNNKYKITDNYDLDDFVAEFKESNDPIVYKDIAKEIIPYYTNNLSYPTEKDYLIDDFVEEFKKKYAFGVYKARALSILPYYTSNDPYQIRKSYDIDDFVNEFKGANDPVLYKEKAQAIIPLYRSNDLFQIGGPRTDVILNYKVTVKKIVQQYSISANRNNIVEGDSVRFTISATVPNGTTLYWTNIGTTNIFDFSLNDSDVIFNSLTTPANPKVFNVNAVDYDAKILNEVGVWEENTKLATFDRTYSINFPNDGTYMIRAACDDYGFLYIDDVEVATFYGREYTRTLEVKGGVRRLRILGINTQGPGCFGMTIKGGPGSNSGSFVVNNGVGTVIVATRNDGLAEQNENIILEIRKDSLQGSVVATSSPVTVVDAPATYITVPKSTSVSETSTKRLTLQSSNWWITNVDGLLNSIPSYLKIDDTVVVQSPGRGITMVVLDPETLTINLKKTFDTWSGGSPVSGGFSEDIAFRNELNAVPAGKLLALFSFDALQLTQGVRSILQNKFGSQKTFTQLGTNAGGRKSYLFLGYCDIPNIVIPPSAVVLSLTGEGLDYSQNFIDSSPNPKLVWALQDLTGSGYPYITTRRSKCGTGSIDFNGQSSLIVSQNVNEEAGRYYTPDFILNNDFTIEGWLWVNTGPTAGLQTIWEFGDWRDGILFRFGSRQDSGLYVNGNRYGPIVQHFPILQWNHFAVVRYGTKIDLYVNGVSLFNFTQPNTINSEGKWLRIGESAHTGYQFSPPMYIDSFKIIKGIAKYRGNFTPNCDQDLVVGGAVPAVVPALYEEISDSRVSPLVFQKTFQSANNIDIQLVTTNVSDNTTLYFDTSSPSDVLVTSGNVVIEKGIGNIRIPIKPDNLVEGTEQITVNIRTGSVSGPIVHTSPPIYINDTSTPPELVASNYTITPLTNTVSEGNNITFNIITTNIPNGTKVFYSSEGKFVTSVEEFDNTGSGTLTINNNSASITVRPRLDQNTEGIEQFKIILRSQTANGPKVAESPMISILDTSTTPVVEDPGFFNPWYTVIGASVSYNPTITPIDDLPGEYKTDTNTPIRITMTGGPPNSIVEITKKADVDGMFGSGYVAGTVLTGTQMLNSNGFYQDDPQFFPLAGTVEYTFKLAAGNIIKRDRWGLFRNPDREGLAYWTNLIISQNIDPTNIDFRGLFFARCTELGATRHLTSDKSFDATSASGGGFYDDPPDGPPIVTRYGLYRWPDRDGLNYWVDETLRENIQINSVLFNNRFFKAADEANENRHLTNAKSFDDTHAVYAPQFRDQPFNWAGPIRYGLFQYPDRESLKTSVNYVISENVNPGSTKFNTAFFNYMSALNRTRHLTQDKAFDNTNTGGGFYDMPPVWPGLDRWGLYRYPDYDGLAYWTTTSLDQNLDPEGIDFRTAFFNAATTSGETRHLTANKIFDPKNNNGGFRADPPGWNQDGSGNINGLTCSKTYKIVSTNNINVFRLVNEDNTEISTTIGNADNLNFYAENKKPNPNLTEVDFQGCWEDCTMYRTHQMVLHAEITWIATRDNTGNEPSITSRYWKEITTEQAAFIDNPPIWKGAWVNNTTYPENSIVSYDNKSWIAKNYIDITITPLPPDQATADWQIIDDPSIYCQVPDPIEPVAPPDAVSIPSLVYTGDYNFENPYRIYYLVNDPRIPTDDLGGLKYAVFPLIPDINPVIGIVKNNVNEGEPNEWKPDKFYNIGDIVELNNTDDILPDRIPNYFNDSRDTTPMVKPELYLAIDTVPPTPSGLDSDRFKPNTNPDKWAKLVPNIEPGAVYPKNAIIAVQDKLFMSLEPTTQIPKVNPDTGTNTRPATIEIPKNQNGSPIWAELLSDGIKGIPINSSYWRPVNTRFRRDWDWRTYYDTGDIVTFCGILYKAIDSSIGAVPPYNMGNLQETSTKWVELNTQDLT